MPAAPKRVWRRYRIVREKAAPRRLAPADDRINFDDIVSGNCTRAPSTTMFREKSLGERVFRHHLFKRRAVNRFAPSPIARDLRVSAYAVAKDQPRKHCVNPAERQSRSLSSSLDGVPEPRGGYFGRRKRSPGKKSPFLHAFMTRPTLPRCQVRVAEHGAHAVLDIMSQMVQLFPACCVRRPADH